MATPADLGPVRPMDGKPGEISPLTGSKFEPGFEDQEFGQNRKHSVCVTTRNVSNVPFVPKCPIFSMSHLRQSNPNRRDRRDFAMPPRE
jgi:hypothetical protein